MNPIDVLKSFSRAQAGIAGLVSAMSLVGGAAAGCAIAMRKLEAKYAEIADREIAEAKVFYKKLHKAEDFASPEQAVDALQVPGIVVDPLLEKATRALVNYQGYSKDPEPEPTMVEVAENVFTNATPPEFDYEKEEASRDPDFPYVITEDEFGVGEFEYDQVTFTYFEGDKVLSNERDQVVPDIDRTVGLANLEKFGYGTKDRNVVHIRNVRLELDFEILRSTGTYSEEVAGFTEGVIQHSKEPLRRFRDREAID
jgi:hypothetical protein